MNRRNFLKNLVGTIAAAALLGETLPPRIPAYFTRILTLLPPLSLEVEVQPMDGPVGFAFYMNYRSA